ncbi:MULTISPECIES: flavin reductase family protein [Mumia]|uniref:flavin reductase family protein n=1 Tax=Mumia TaxID=1546255 RepID=UPI001420164E|nr:flavin reductase family protein [Mumia sp. ZJ430]
MTIHSDHPFLPPEGERDPLRRLRGRLPQAVTLCTAGEGRTRVGLTVSSVVVADGAPARVLLLVDEDSDLADTLEVGGPFVVNVLGARDRALADPFAGTAPAPGGVFTLGVWRQTLFGPVLESAAAWLGARVAVEPRQVGWPLLVEGVVEHVEIGEDGPALTHVRGRYLDLG